MKLPRCVIDRIIRRKVRLHAAPLGRFTVRVARTTREYEEAFALVRTAYVFMGIESLTSAPLRITDQHVLAESFVLVAHEGDELVGTMTVTMDSAAGLPLDKDYPNELAEQRDLGRRLCEFGSLAIVSRCHHSGVSTLLNMTAIRLARETLAASHVVMGIHPKATPVYRALWGFTPMGRAQEHANLRAPVASMVLALEGLETHLESHYRRPMATGHNVADHFFGTPFPGVELPPSHLSAESLERWKLPREVFRDLFVRHSNRLATLPEKTREVLARERSPETLRRATAFGADTARAIIAEVQGQQGQQRQAREQTPALA